MIQAVQSLRRDHLQMGRWWAELRLPLGRRSQVGAGERIEDTTPRTIAALRALYATHLVAAEDLVFPAAKAQMDSAAQTAMGQQMQARRRT